MYKPLIYEVGYTRDFTKSKIIIRVIAYGKMDAISTGMVRLGSKAYYWRWNDFIKCIGVVK